MLRVKYDASYKYTTVYLVLKSAAKEKQQLFIALTLVLLL